MSAGSVVIDVVMGGWLALGVRLAVVTHMADRRRRRALTAALARLRDDPRYFATLPSPTEQQR